MFFSFFFNDTATTEIYTLSLHDALPICRSVQFTRRDHRQPFWRHPAGLPFAEHARAVMGKHSASFSACREDRKSTRLNSSHSSISYAVFCLKKKKKSSKSSTQR